MDTRQASSNVPEKNLETLIVQGIPWQESFVKMVKKYNIAGYTIRVIIIIALLILGCSDGEVQLVGGMTAMEGTVEICYRNLWGLILTADWDKNDTAVACATAGFARYGKQLNTNDMSYSVYKYYYYRCYWFH